MQQQVAENSIVNWLRSCLLRLRGVIVASTLVTFLVYLAFGSGNFAAGAGDRINCRLAVRLLLRLRNALARKFTASQRPMTFLI